MVEALESDGMQPNDMPQSSDQQQVDQQLLQGPNLNLSTSALPIVTQADPAQLESSSPVLGAQARASAANDQQCKLTK